MTIVKQEDLEKSIAYKSGYRAGVKYALEASNLEEKYKNSFFSEIPEKDRLIKMGYTYAIYDQHKKIQELLKEK